MSNIEQSATKGGQNINAGRDVSITINSLDVDELISELARNLPQLAARAEAEKKRRTSIFSGKFWATLISRNAITEAKLDDPGVQPAITDALSSYVRSGNEDAADILADLLADRSLHIAADIRQFCLDDAIPIAAKLDSEHLKALSLLLFVTWTTFDWSEGYESLYSNACSFFVPFGETLSITETDIRYLESNRCSAWATRSRTIPEIFREKYPGLFTTGFTLDRDPVLRGLASTSVTLSDGSAPVPVLIPCYRDASLWQVNAVTNSGLEALLATITDEAQLNFLRHANRNLTMSDEAIASELVATDARMKATMKNWASTSLMRQTISAIGVTIANANARRVLGDTYDATIDLWLPPRTSKGANPM